MVLYILRDAHIPLIFQLLRVNVLCRNMKYKLVAFSTKIVYKTGKLNILIIHHFKGIMHQQCWRRGEVNEKYDLVGYQRIVSRD